MGRLSVEMGRLFSRWATSPVNHLGFPLWQSQEPSQRPSHCHAEDTNAATDRYGISHKCMFITPSPYPGFTSHAPDPLQAPA